jgi:hypothetical protein
LPALEEEGILVENLKNVVLVTVVRAEQTVLTLKARQNIDLESPVSVQSDGGGMSSHDLEVPALSNWQVGKVSLKELVEKFVRGRMSDLSPDL